jgi:hypothetical protein
VILKDLKIFYQKPTIFRKRKKKVKHHRVAKVSRNSLTLSLLKKKLNKLRKNNLIRKNLKEKSKKKVKIN